MILYATPWHSVNKKYAARKTLEFTLWYLLNRKWKTNVVIKIRKIELMLLLYPESPMQK